MAQICIPRVIIAAVSSGCGKTTIVSGLLAALKRAGRSVQSYKVGPDYIDPGYHQLAGGRPAHNLDTWLTDDSVISDILAQTYADADMALIEGVMGLYDGGKKGVSSTASLAKLLRAPVVLVIDVKSMGDSAAAIALGFKNYDSDVNLAGVILNRVGSPSHAEMLREAMAKINMPVLGVVYRNQAMQLPERHLGLTPVTENDAAAVMDTISRAIAEQIDVDALCRLCMTAPPLTVNDEPATESAQAARPVRIGVAHDDAFTFYYPESLRVLERYGAKIVNFSPLQDKTLPDVDGIVIGGGFPEMFVDKLAANESLRRAIYQAGRAGMPIYAECGGLMYLTRQITDFEGREFAMVGLIPASCTMNDKLQTVGYVRATALTDSPLGAPGTVMCGHEFHFSSMTADTADDFPWAFEFEKVRTGNRYPAGYAAGNILASYLHLHFLGNTAAARNFVAACAAYAKTSGERRD